jgi:hypothetical protein
MRLARPARPALLACALLALAVLPAPASWAHHSSLPLVASAALPGSGAFGIRVATLTGAIDLDIAAAGPKTGSTDGIGVLMYEEDGDLRFGFAVTGHGSPDRLVLTPLGADPEVQVALREAATDAHCTYSCLGLTVRTAPGTYRFVMYSAGLAGATQLDVFGDGAPQVALSTGSTVALGDPEILAGNPNVQVQQRLAGFHGLGVKVMRDAPVHLDVAAQLHGFWGFNNVKFACNSLLPIPLPCAQTSLLDLACQTVADVSCDAAVLSWEGPDGEGLGQRTFGFFGTPPGAYTFTVDLKVDAYNPGGGLYDPVTRTFAVAYENYSYLVAADVALPG